MEKSTIALIIILTALLVFISYKCTCSESFKTGKTKSHTRSTPGSISKELETKLKSGKINTSKKIKVSELYKLFYNKIKRENPKVTKDEVKKEWNLKLNQYIAYMKSKNMGSDH
jgi:hypothetical protein